MFQVCTLERIPYIFLCNDAIDIYIILTESHDQGLSNKPIYNLRNTLVNEIHVEQSKCPKHLKHFWGHCTSHLCHHPCVLTTPLPSKPGTTPQCGLASHNSSTLEAHNCVQWWLLLNLLPCGLHTHYSPLPLT